MSIFGKMKRGASVFWRDVVVLHVTAFAEFHAHSRNMRDAQARETQGDIRDGGADWRVRHDEGGYQAEALTEAPAAMTRPAESFRCAWRDRGLA